MPCTNPLNRRKILGVLTLAILAISHNAHARSINSRWIIKDPSTHSRDMFLDIGAVAGAGGVGAPAGKHFGPSAWISMPLIRDGFLPSINDSVDFEAGAHVEYWRWSDASCAKKWLRVTPMAGLRWNFYLTHRWTVFAKTKFGAAIGFADDLNCSGASSVSIPSNSEFATDIGGGMFWHWGRAALRLDLGNYGAGLGISFKL
ncbi:MAG: hypothetical protein R3C68_01855 [Myxococcota bacterium]